MEKRKRWQFWLIVGVLVLTLYNILPTLFFYSRPLDKPVGEKTAHRVAEQSAMRVDRLEGQSVAWLKAFSKNLKVKPKSITLDDADPKLIRVAFKKPGDAKIFERYLGEAGSRIPFAPAQLALAPSEKEGEVIVQRRVSSLSDDVFSFATKDSAEYRKVVHDRLFAVAEAASTRESQETALDAARQIVEYKKAFGVNSPVSLRFYAGYGDVSSLIAGLEKASSSLGDDSIALRQKALVDEALAVVNENRSAFTAGIAPLGDVSGDVIEIGDRNPFIEKVAIDWDSEQIALALHKDVQGLLDADTLSEEGAFTLEKAQQLLINEIAYISRGADEQIVPDGQDYTIALNDLAGAESYLVMDLAAFAKGQVQEVKAHLEQVWNPTHADLAREQFPIWDSETYNKLSADQRQLGLLVYAPIAGKEIPGFRDSSLYVIARGVGHIGERATGLETDLRTLQEVMAQEGFLGYQGSGEFKNDWIFERPDYYAETLMATREKFNVRGTKRYAVLDFSTEKQRLLTTNEIETREHEDLIKWRDDYQAAQVSMRPEMKYLVPPVTTSILWNNVKLSTRKYFRGDERKVLNWGLDLSGGKSVTIGLRDINNRPVTDPADIHQGINELTARVNKMGVSEVEVRQEGDHIVLNFPGAQALSASELVKASTMSFHIVNEKFSRQNPTLASATDRFLQEVWNEAVVNNRTDMENLNQIAYQQLQGPRSESGELLWENGLRIEEAPKSNVFDETLSAIARFRGDTYSEWQGNANPLIVIFHNYALEGTNLGKVSGQYDPAKGNKLVFEVKGSAVRDGQRINPRADFYEWTSQFAEDRILGTPKELYSRGQGWRMAIILNGSMVSNPPSLKSALKAGGEVTGNFSQREINQLVADLKAGSLTFTPKILSEKNVSPDLGQAERSQGIIAAGAGLLLVILAMLWYYRFAGIVAGCAVTFNLLIMWGVLQNLDAALTLPGIAGIILTIGMAVDANVLVFERIREEFAISGRISSAIQMGYKKAFSAIVDSNVTTLIAAFILLHFDAGPIKGFAVTLIIGIISSMFTALFMTRYFFAGWVQNPKHKELKMMNLFKNSNFNFLGKTKIAVVGAVIVIAVGGSFFFMQRHTMFGMDFTGGYTLNVNLEKGNASLAKQALIDAGVPSADVQVRTLNRANQLRIQLGIGLEQLGRPFHGMPQEVSPEGAIYSYESNPRISWVVGALASAGLQVKPEMLPTLDSHWSAMSGQFSDTMRTSAIWGLSLALLSILVYITFRFEFKYAISSIVALGHDLLVTVGLMAILHQMGVPIQIDLQVIGALMTIIGYSLNDTIVIFDRIREDSRVYRKLSFHDLINRALNTTLNRTLITSGTTLLVLLALDMFGGMAIFGFSLVMTMGVVVGTFSSIFIASPVLLYFHNREVAGREIA